MAQGLTMAVIMDLKFYELHFGILASWGGAGSADPVYHPTATFRYVKGDHIQIGWCLSPGYYMGPIGWRARVYLP